MQVEPGQALVLENFVRINLLFLDDFLFLIGFMAAQKRTILRTVDFLLPEETAAEWA